MQGEQIEPAVGRRANQVRAPAHQAVTSLEPVGRDKRHIAAHHHRRAVLGDAGGQGGLHALPQIALGLESLLKIQTFGQCGNKRVMQMRGDTQHGSPGPVRGGLGGAVLKHQAGQFNAAPVTQMRAQAGLNAACRRHFGEQIQRPVGRAIGHARTMPRGAPGRRRSDSPSACSGSDITA